MKKNQKMLIIFVVFIIAILVVLKSVYFGNKKIQIILISIDTLRADHLTPYGYSRDTSPNLSSLTRESVLFTYAYPNRCWTNPSHMSLLTGTLPSRHGVNSDLGIFVKEIFGKEHPILKEQPILKDSVKTISEVLKNNKINTIKIADLPDELGFNRGFNFNEKIDPFQKTDSFNIVLKQLENNKESNFFLFIHTWMVHAPYSNSYFLKKDKLTKEKLNFIDNFRNLEKGNENKDGDFWLFLEQNNLNNITDCIDLYDGCIHLVDQYIGKIINKCKHLGIYDNLMFIVVSDHGEHFNDHFPNIFYNYHGSYFYEEFIRVPLIIKSPRNSKSKIINNPVPLMNVYPTILDYYKIKIPSFVQGNSFLEPFSKRKKGI
jgi:arylsulfatase A-like enzyme